MNTLIFIVLFCYLIFNIYDLFCIRIDIKKDKLIFKCQQEQRDINRYLERYWEIINKKEYDRLIFLLTYLDNRIYNIKNHEKIHHLQKPAFI